MAAYCRGQGRIRFRLVPATGRIVSIAIRRGFSNADDAEFAIIIPGNLLRPLE